MKITDSNAQFPSAELSVPWQMFILCLCALAIALLIINDSGPLVLKEEKGGFECGLKEEEEEDAGGF